MEARTGLVRRMAFAAACGMAFVVFGDVDWIDIGPKVAEREAAVAAVTGVDGYDTQEAFLASIPPIVKSVETVADGRPFDSLTFTLGFSDSDRFYSIYRPGVLLFVR